MSRPTAAQAHRRLMALSLGLVWFTLITLSLIALYHGAPAAHPAQTIGP